MTSRSFTSKRPLSAIFLGNLPSPSTLPDLPEPPSPGAASNGSGLPSPPATNSTGSGSTGDTHSNDAGSTRRRPISFSDSTNMYNGSYHQEIKGTRNHGDDYDDDDENGFDNENEEDNTARIERRRSLRSPSENVLALQRVKSLTQRNRMVYPMHVLSRVFISLLRANEPCAGTLQLQAIDKLSSISRLSTPSPSHGSRSSRSPNPPSASASSSSASSSTSSSAHVSLHSHSRSEPRRPPPEPHLSGSETERESQRLAHSYSSDDLSATPPSTLSARPHTSSNYNSTNRLRRISAPASPAKALARTSRDRGRESPGPSRTPRKRVSLAMDVPPEEEGYEGDVTSAALAAVASSRRSPTNGKRARQPLPKEFRHSLDGRSSNEPPTPHHQQDRDRNVLVGRGSPSPRSAAATLSANAQRSPRAPRTTRSSTVRELTRRHQTRWVSEDLTATIGDRDDDDEGQVAEGSGLGRRQTQRGGSTELVGNGRSLVSEGLRAAGIKRREGVGDDVFGGGPSNGKGAELSVGVGSQRRVPSNGGGSSSGNGDWEMVEKGSSRSGGSSNRNSEPLARGQTDPRTPANRGTLSNRPATSMAEYRDVNPPRTAPPALRTQRSAYPLGERARSGSVRQQIPPQQPQPPPNDRPYSSARRNPPTPAPPSSSASHTTPGTHQHTNSEHGRLMLDALSIFESNLSRLPPMGTTTTSTIPELFRAAQSIVHSSDKLNDMLRAGTSHALEEQIDAEVADDNGGPDMVEVWRKVGSEYRDNLRVSDEIVRTMTGFLLGIGKVLKESASSADGRQQHTRSMSDEDATRRPSPEVGLDNARRSDGRRSTQSRHSWEPLPRDQDDTISRRLPTRREALPDARPPSVLNTRRDEGEYDSPPPAGNLTRSGTVPASGSMRRLYTPREQREQRAQLSMGAAGARLTSNDSPGPGYEPSPTPASRQQAYASNSRTLPPLSIPPPLPSLPSESLLNHSASDRTNRRKISTNSVVTVRANPTFPVISTPNATTALTPHTVSNSPEKTSFPLVRTDSAGSTRVNNVTFSRPSTVSVSALNGLQYRDKSRDRIRTSSSSSNLQEEPPVPTPTSSVRSPMSGSETERPDSRRRTLGARAARISLDNAMPTVHDTEGPGNQSETMLPSTVRRRERRRTVTEVFSQSS
ncbi:hypothetical protein PLICRDRAFT_542275 [Plicaturopsis crispa FD-325 SS-3]|nr:hypothetical protein PLICRDRAFT_542275 [Plicaturopsis crispa FD-325 SS-3]